MQKVLADENLCAVLDLDAQGWHNSGLDLTLWTSEADIPALRKLSCGVRSRYTGGMVCQRQASEVGIPPLFSNAYWHLNARVIEIQTRQQL